jgi:hypothetical protein
MTEGFVNQIETNQNKSLEDQELLDFLSKEENIKVIANLLPEV